MNNIFPVTDDVFPYNKSVHNAKGNHLETILYSEPEILHKKGPGRSLHSCPR